MLQNYLPIYQIALSLGKLLNHAELMKDIRSPVSPANLESFHELLEVMPREFELHNFTFTAALAARVSARPPPQTSADMVHVLNHLNDSLVTELEREAVFRITPEGKAYFEQDDLFGPKISVAFPSCARDIRKAGSCYALEQEDACVHHLMLVLERGLNALAAKVGVPYQRTNWQNIIDQIGAKLKSLPRGTERDFYTEVNAQFGFLKDAYRNHSEHARDDYYDMPKVLSILNHVREFMQALEKGGLSE